MHRHVIRRIGFGWWALVLLVGLSAASAVDAAEKPSIKALSPSDGATITTTDIPVNVEVKNFRLSPEHVGMPDVDGEGHIHVMVDGMNMGVLFNFYTTPSFTLPGDGLRPGPHTLIFDLASNTHMDMAETATQVKINYQPANPKPAPAPVNFAAPPSVEILSPRDGATVGPVVSFEVRPANFNPATELEGKPNLAGWGHYHVFVDMDMASMQPGAMMSMAGMVLMPGANTFSIDLRAWKPGKHVITVEPVQNDHTTIKNANAAMVTVNLQSAPQTLPTTGAEDSNGSLAAALLAAAGIVALAGGWLLRRRA